VAATREPVKATSTNLIRGPLEFLGGRGGLAVALAFLLAAQNTYASTLAASAFLARVGAHGMPLYYICFAGVSIPFAVFFSSVIDRFPRRVLLISGLAIFTGITIVLPMLPAANIAVPYGSYLIVRVFEHLLYSIYYILIADYFTVLENKRYAARIALGMAFGGLAGGGLLTGVTAVVGSHGAAWTTPVLVALALIYGAWITQRRQPLDAAAPASPESLAESLKIIPRLLARYPLIALMSGAMMLNILLQCMAEFLAFSIYTARFPRIDQLAVFLGIVNAGLSLLGFLIIVLFTGRQLPRLGVPKMNLVYPLLDVATFSVLTITPSLPAGILSNISYDPFEHGIDVPVMTMNYNAIRHRFVGRVRVFIDGIVFPVGLASAGALLLVAAARLDLRVIAAFGLVLSLKASATSMSCSPAMCAPHWSGWRWRRAARARSRAPRSPQRWPRYRRKMRAACCRGWRRMAAPLSRRWQRAGRRASVSSLWSISSRPARQTPSARGRC